MSGRKESFFNKGKSRFPQPVDKFIIDDGQNPSDSGIARISEAKVIHMSKWIELYTIFLNVWITKETLEILNNQVC